MSTIIHSNGSKWAGEEPDGIEVLMKRLAEETLDPRFEQYGNFMQNHSALQWLYGAPEWSCLGMVRFWGNFLTYSHVFQIDTDDEAVIHPLMAAIKANMATPAYRAARIDILREKHD